MIGVCGESSPDRQARLWSLIDTCIESLKLELHVMTYTLIQLKAPYQQLITQRQALVDREAEEKPAEERRAEEKAEEAAAAETAATQKLTEEHRVLVQQEAEERAI